MKKFLLLIFVFAASLLAYSPAEAIIHVEGRYWFTTLDSKVKVTDAGIIGTEINAVDTLGMDKSKGFPEGRVDLNLGSHHIRYAYLPLSWEGHKTITQSITFKGATYTASTNVDSKLNVVYQRLGYRYDIIDMLDNQLGIIIDVKLLGIDAQLKDPSLILDKTYSLTVPVPTLGIGAQIGLPFLFSISAEVTGMAYSGNSLVDGEASVNFNPVPFTTISGGYRIFNVEVKDGDNKGNFNLSGPYLMVRIGW